MSGSNGPTWIIVNKSGTNRGDPDTSVVFWCKGFAIDERIETENPQWIGVKDTHGLTGGQIPKRFVAGDDVQEIGVTEHGRDSVFTRSQKAFSTDEETDYSSG